MDQRGVISLVKTMADGVERLVSDHLLLARMTLGEEARVVGRRIALIGACLPFAIVGYALICAAVAIFLAPTLGLGWALLLVGAVGLVGAAVAIALLRYSGKARHVGA